jgi:hypothetical protein
VLSLSILLFSSMPAFADCPSALDPDGRVSEAEAGARVERIGAALAEDAADAELWTGAWLLTYAAITAGQLGALVLLDDPGERTDLYVGIAGSFGALAGIPLFPLAVLEDGPLLATYDADVCRELAIAERTLERDAENEAMGVAWFVHVANVAVNLALGLLLGVGYDRWLSAAISAASGTAIGELMLFTQPTGAIDALEEMRAR